MTRRWWAPVRAELDARAARPTAAVLRLLQHALLSSTSSPGWRASARHELVAFVERGHADDLLRGARALPRGPHRGLVGELPVLRRARLLRRRRPRAAAERREAEAAAGVKHLRSHDRAAGRRPGHPAGAAGPTRWTRGWARSTPRRLAPQRARSSSTSTTRSASPPTTSCARSPSTGRPARRLRARQGGDAQRRRRRRDDLERRPRRALGHDVLARQRLHRRRHRARPAFRHGPGQPARGDRQEHVPAEPRLPGLLLPRGVHGRRDGGRPVTATPSTRSPTPSATRSARPSTSPSSRSTSGSSTTPLTRPYTQARTLGARGLSYYGMDSTYASSLAILRRVLRLEGALE